MTITLQPATEAKLLDKARREGQDPSKIVNDALSAFLEPDTPEVSEDSFVSALPPVQVGEDPRLAILREMEAQSRFMKTKPSQRDYLHEGRSGGMFERHTKA